MKKQLNSHLFEEVYKDLKINLNTLGCVMLDLEPLNSMNENDNMGMKDFTIQFFLKENGLVVG